MRRLALTFVAFSALAASAHAGVSLVAEAPDAASSSAGPAATSPDAATQGKSLAQPLDKPFDDPHKADNVTIDAVDDPRCDFKPPAPALIAARYADYRAERNRDDTKGSPGDLTETATLGDGTRVRVLSYGCVDSTGHTFEFTYAKSQHAAKDVAYWAAQARTTLDTLALADNVYGAQELQAWLAHAAALKVQDHKIVQCHDKTQPPDNSCNWNSGGEFSLAIEARRDTIVVTVGVDYSG